MICMLYLNKHEKVTKKCKCIEKCAYRTLKVSYPLGCRNISKVIKGRNVHLRFN